MHEVLVNRLGGLSLPRKSVARLTDRHDMTLDVYCGRCIVVLLFYVHGKHLRSCRDGQLVNHTFPGQA